MTWPHDPVLEGLLVLTGVWYWRGRQIAYVRSLPAGRRRRRDTRWQAAAFYAALALLLFSLSSLDGLADELFSAHMLQHVLLLLGVAPLIVVAAPWNALWRPFPLRFRRALAGTVAHASFFAPLRRLGRLLALPLPAWCVLNADIGLWHLPAMYDLTLRNTAVHYLEHISFVLFGVLFWAQTIDSPPLRSRLGYFQRAVFAGAGALAGWILAVVLALSPHALYSGYLAVEHRPGGISAYTDQQLAAGVMWGPGSVTYAIVVFWALYRWLDDEERVKVRRRRSQVGASAARHGAT